MNLYEQNDYLKEEVRQLRAMLAPAEFPIPREWGLTRCEAKLLGSLYSSKDGFRAHDALLESCLNTESDPNVIKVRISHIRRKLKPLGIEIKTVWGEGYSLSEESKLLIARAISVQQIFSLADQSASA